MADKDSKTEKATPKKRRDERKEGNVFMSKDVVSLAVILVSFYGIKVFFPGIYQRSRNMMITLIEIAGRADTSVNLESIKNHFMIDAAWCMLPILFICMLSGIVGTGAQTKFLFSTKAAKPKFSRLNPLQGIKKMFSLRNVVELIKNILKVVILIAVLRGIMMDNLVSVVKTMDMDIKSSTAYMFKLVFSMVMKLVLIFTAIAIFDYLYQWWEYERNLKMSKEELKEEYKQTEGNPEIKGRIKQLQQKMAQQRMMQEVPGADVIIKNPTHFAVALRYDAEKDNAPCVVAKGQDYLALRIIDVGEKNGVDVIENRPLARGLYASTEVGMDIPEEFYSAVAEILVYVFKLK